ncbi:hypothetical protein XB02_14515 [Pantoea ananatis]|nr:hypothetical protein XB02_14515 [Pantoea ananatis]
MSLQPYKRFAAVCFFKRHREHEVIFFTTQARDIFTLTEKCLTGGFRHQPVSAHQKALTGAAPHRALIFAARRILLVTRVMLIMTRCQLRQ